MTPEQQKYFDDLEWLFVQPGWRTFMETFEGFKTSLADQAYSHNTMEAYYFAKGRMNCFDQVLGFPDLVEQLKIAALAAQQEELENASDV